MNNYEQGWHAARVDHENWGIEAAKSMAIEMMINSAGDAYLTGYKAYVEENK